MLLTSAHAQTSPGTPKIQASERKHSARKERLGTEEQQCADLRERALNYADASNFKQAVQLSRAEILRRQRFDADGLPESWIILGNIYRLQGLYANANVWVKRGITSLEVNHPTDYQRLSAAYNYLALLQNSTGNFRDSEASARKALTLSQQAQLPEDVAAMHTVVLANALRQQGKYQEAMPLLQSTLPILKKSPNNAVLFATATNNFGALYFWTGDYPKALSILEEGLRLRQAVHPADHPDIANSYLDLGCTEFRLGQSDLAIDHLTKALSIRQRKLGKSHPETLSAMANLAVTLESTGNSKRALPILADTVRTAKHVLGSKHPDLAQYEDDYANVLVSAGLLKKARLYQADSLAIRKNIYGITSSEFAAGLRSAARIEIADDKNDQALSLLQRSADIYAAAGQRSDQDYADTLEELGTVHFERNNLEAAHAAYALAIEKRSATGQTISYAVSLANLAEVQGRMNKSTESRATLRKAVDIVKSLPENQKSLPDCQFILERYKKIPTEVDQLKKVPLAGH